MRISPPKSKYEIMLALATTVTFIGGVLGITFANLISALTPLTTEETETLHSITLKAFVATGFMAGLTLGKKVSENHFNQDILPR